MIAAIDGQLSKRINSLRFLLIVFVVFIHSGITEEGLAGRNITVEIPIYVAKIQIIVSDIISRVAVPLFFLISGFLLYAKEPKFSTVLKKKSRTLLLPLLLWNLLFVLVYFLMQNLSFTKAFFNSSAEDLIHNYSLLDWIDVFVGKFTARREYNFPFDYPLWFIRDLYILVILFIGIKKAIDKFPFGTFIVFFILWITNITIYIISPEALFFFSLGYYIVKYSLKVNKIDSIKIYELSIIYITTILIELFFNEYVPIIHKINIIIGCMFFLKISLYFVKNVKLYAALVWLEKYEFIVYAIHAFILPQLLKLSIKLF
ncbi:MAG: acyltransferase family protein, partial [Treponema sp.]|nr:acyltransferase family protein [Treponema sp.]